MNILIVEDDENKLHQIRGFLQSSLSHVIINEARSYMTGLRSIVEGTYDLLLLDMTMRNYDVSTEEEGGRPRKYAGRLLLLQMERRDIVVPAILITQFDTFIEGGKLVTLAQLDADLARQFPTTYNGAIYYDAAVEGWKRELREKIARIFRHRTGVTCGS